ncbi:hypothetical protein L218DRAFT_935778 [Marasmius fiardii PR-910]|nr:hypothetical protein L218DRAFT_935778 [Marasmius fiardii PR-910]
MDSAQISQPCVQNVSFNELSDAIVRLSDCVQRLSSGLENGGVNKNTKISSSVNAGKETDQEQSTLNPPSQSKNAVERENPSAGASLEYDLPRPTIEKSWEELTKKMDTLNEDFANGYKDDIDTLLVFAGLFSGVLTAFTLESYKWLQEDPTDTTVALLNATVLLLTGLTQCNSTESLLPSIDSSPLPLHFTPSSSAVRINTFWFLSLTLTLVDGLFGLLCKQWLRAYQQQTNTHTPGEFLAIRWLRYQSFEHWHVPKILASLPMLLEIALCLFFAGLLELLWNNHPIPFAIAFTVIGFGIGFYLITTVLPGLNIIQQVLQLSPILYTHETFSPAEIPHLPSINLLCSYRSPQSWLVFQLLSSMFHFPGCKHLLQFLLGNLSSKWKEDRKWNRNALDQIINRDIHSLSDWPSLDLNVRQRFSRRKQCPNLYEIKGFRWLVQHTRDSPSLVPHLKNVLGELPLHLVMPAVLDNWDSPTAIPEHILASNSSMETFFHYNDIFNDQSSPNNLTIASQILCLHHLTVT